MELATLTAKEDKQVAAWGKATLAEVAELAGVSKMAASLVLNNSGTGTRVSSATRERIMKAAATLRYTPNANARSLVRKKTDVIAFYNAHNVAFDPTYPFYASILAGIQDGCTEHHKDLLVHANFQGRSDDDVFLRLHNGQIDGLVLYAQARTPFVERLVESHLPVVTIDQQVEGLPYVWIDEERGARMLARHLAKKGYHRVLYRSLKAESTPRTQLRRITAFCDEAAILGLEVSHTHYDPVSGWGELESEEKALLLSDRRPEVVVCWADVSADQLALFCMENGLRVPEDIALVGFDGLISGYRPCLRLTTIAAPWRQVARTAVGLLAARCSGKEVPERTILPVELIEGDTT